MLYHTREGYCARATERCILKSFDRFPPHLVPEQKPGESNPDRWRAGLEELAKREHLAIPNIRITVVRGDVPLDKFLSTLNKVNNENVRVAVNYLRPALVGFARPKWVPLHFVLGLFGGHFSPILGILKNKDDPKDPLVAIFDVNHKYGGTIWSPPRDSISRSRRWMFRRVKAGLLLSLKCLEMSVLPVTKVYLYK